MTTTATPDIASLRDEVESLRLQDEASQLRSVLRHRDEAERLIESWGDFVDPFDALRSEPELFGGSVGCGRADRPDDRRDGDYAPHVRNETDLARIRGACVYLADTDLTVIGAFETLAAFVLKQGGAFEVVATKPEGEGFIEPVKDVLDEFTNRVGWYGGVDKESLMRTRKAGTRYMRITDCGDGKAGVEFYEPSWITEPQNHEEIARHYGLAEGLSWKYGIVTDPHNVSNVHGFYAAKNGDGNCGEFIPTDEMDRMKVNTDSNSKIGLPDIYAGRAWVEKCIKVLERTMDGAAIQASIALRRTYPAAMKNTAVQSAADAQVDFRLTVPQIGGGSKSAAFQKFDSGTVVDNKGVNYEAGPMGDSQGEIYIAVLQAGLRMLSRRWGFTEDSISGDASNQNRASLAEAGSTSLTRMQSNQVDIATNDVGIFWRVVDRAIRGGRLIVESLEWLKEVIAIKVTPADIEHKDRKSEHDIRKEENEAGILSDESWTAETGRDYQEEQDKIARQPQKMLPQLGLPGMGPPMQQQATGELPPMLGGLQQSFPESRAGTLAVRAMALLLENTA